MTICLSEASRSASARITRRSGCAQRRYSAGAVGQASVKAISMLRLGGGAAKHVDELAFLGPSPCSRSRCAVSPAAVLDALDLHCRPVLRGARPWPSARPSSLQSAHTSRGAEEVAAGIVCRGLIRSLGRPRRGIKRGHRLLGADHCRCRTGRRATPCGRSAGTLEPGSELARVVGIWPRTTLWT